MDWHAYNQYGNPPNPPYQMPGQGFPPPQYPQTWQSQPPMMPQNVQPSPPPPQQYQQYPQHYQYQQHQQQLPPHQPHQQYQHQPVFAPQPYTQPTLPQHNQSRPVLMVPQRSAEYLSQFQDYVQHPIAQQPSKPQQRTPPMAQPQRRVSHQQQMPPPPKPKPPEVTVQPSPVPPKVQELPVDLPLLLMSLADEYITEARAMGSIAAVKRREEDLQQYYKLMATGMGCLDAILRKQRLQPRAEASLRLRYATLLYEETNNDMDIEQMLSKGILLCERNRFLDLKYSMQYLQAKALFRSKPKAAITSIDKAIQDAETLQITAWIYAFRFLRFSLSLQRGRPQDLLAALQQLRSIASMASRHEDNDISVTCAVFEATVHLRSGAADSMEQVQRAVAIARRYLLQITAKKSPQVNALLIVIELACSLQMHQSAEEVQKKMQAMQSIMDNTDEDVQKSWRSDSTFTVPLSHEVDRKLVETTGGIFQSREDGKTLLTFAWLPQRDLYMLGYYLSGVTTFQIKPTSDIKATEYLKEGAKQAQASLKAPDTEPTNLAYASTRLQWQATMHWYMQLHLAFIACQRADWKAARLHLKALGSAREDPVINMTDDDTQWLHYFTAVVAQGTGDLETAFEIFQSERFILPDERSTQRHSLAHNDLCVLAALDSLLIIRTPSHREHHRYHAILAKLEPICFMHPNQNIQSAFALVRSIAPRSNPTESMIVKTKQHLQAALQLAKPIPNNQLLAMSLNFMTALFFKDIVGDQAEKSARTGQHLAKRARSNLWMSVADGQLGETLDKCGKREEAAQIRAESEKLVATLPKGLRQLCEQG